ncbi:MAG: CCA tRNA nucleotidyltransferase [candidate division WOR-3 bacterium]|nr:MAG: CCA tRNA nucleotidyltransferase [candidate division WOR-3 bacterium]
MATSKSSAKTKKKSVLRKVIDFFVKSEYHAYLVGGYVRDSTLGRESVDIDVVVEGDGVKAARLLNASLKGKLTSHNEFGTASISIDSYRVDLASARTEKYPSPAHLPHVYPSTIVEDLNRRDFTINAIAMSISKENFGEIFDPFDGMSDIKRKLIRILHRNSFVDDPTRIFRALRYKNRFGFKLEDETERQMKQAVKERMVQKLSAQRILNELGLIFAETSFKAMVNDLSHYGVIEVKRSELKLMPGSSKHAFFFLLSRLPRNAIPLSKEDRKIVDDFRNITGIMAKLSRTSKRSAIYSILYPMTDELIEAIALLKPELTDKIKTYRRMLKLKPFITGQDLRKYRVVPSKSYAKVLKKLFALQLDSKFKNRKEAIVYLKAKKKR